MEVMRPHAPMHGRVSLNEGLPTCKPDWEIVKVAYEAWVGHGYGAGAAAKWGREDTNLGAGAAAGSGWCMECDDVGAGAAAWNDENERIGAGAAAVNPRKNDFGRHLQRKIVGMALICW